MKIQPYLCAAFLALLLWQTVSAQEHHHEQGEPAAAAEPPRIFLDKSPRIVAYQLGRLDNERLLLVERNTEDPKYAPVYSAILTRAGMSPQYLEEALSGLVTINKSDPTSELLGALETLDTKDRQQMRTGRQLAGMLLSQPPSELLARQKVLTEATSAENGFIRAVGFAGLISAGLAAEAWSAAARDTQATLDWLAAVPLVPSAEQRGKLRDTVVELMAASQSVPIRLSAIESLAFIPADQDKSFELVAPLVGEETFRDRAVKTLLRIPPDKRSVSVCEQTAELLVKHAEETPAAERTTNQFIAAMQLADQLLARLPAEKSRPLRNRLREVTVRVVVIHTVEEEMRYDTPYFAVEAGRPVQVVLRNEDLMPHNFVIAVPGALQEVALAGAELGPRPGFQGKPYVPDTKQVLFATDMVAAHTQERLTFTAPNEPGEYPFVCTFPRHWMRMYGVMIVVPDLDEWTRNPTTPQDPIGNNRAFVQSWTVDDLKSELANGLQGRSAEIGARLFKEATCAQCHKIHGAGGAVGPELTDVDKRFKGDRVAVLREILDPFHRIDPKYAVHIVVDADGRVVTGIIQAEDLDSISILDNPESPQPTVIQKSDIEERVKTSKSMMPKALLDRFTQDEIFELLAYVLGVSNPPVP